MTKTKKILIVFSDWGFPNDYQTKCQRCSKPIFTRSGNIGVPLSPAELKNATFIFCCNQCFPHVYKKREFALIIINERAREGFSIAWKDEEGKLCFFGKPHPKKKR
jgi:hypothetical protein